MVHLTCRKLSLSYFGSSKVKVDNFLDLQLGNCIYKINRVKKLKKLITKLVGLQQRSLHHLAVDLADHFSE